MPSRPFQFVTPTVEGDVLAALARAGAAFTPPQVRHVIWLVECRDEALQRMRVQLRAWAVPCEFAALFGSAGTGAMTAESDIDMLVVRPDSVPPAAEEVVGDFVKVGDDSIAHHRQSFVRRHELQLVDADARAVTHWMHSRGDDGGPFCEQRSLSCRPRSGYAVAGYL